MLILILSLVVVLLDQGTKFMVRQRFSLGESLPVLPGFLDLTYVRNTGAAWGMFSGFGHVLVFVSIVMLTVLIVFRRRFLTDTLLHRIASGLMVAGIVGNLVDRIRLGYVVDFVDFYWRTHHFPAFNVADAAICVGVGIYILTQHVSGNPDIPPREAATGDESRDIKDGRRERD